MLLTSAGLTAVSLLIVQRIVERQVRSNLRVDLANSVETFRNFQKEREDALARSAALMADLPVLKALMTSRHAPTIQDASGELFPALWRRPVCPRRRQQPHRWFPHPHRQALRQIRRKILREAKTGADSARQWWFAGGHLYEVFLTPIYFGPTENQSILGTLAVGYEINQKVAHELARAASGEVAVICAGQEVVSTIDPANIPTLQQALAAHGASDEPFDVKLENESFVMTSLKLNDGSPPVTILVHEVVTTRPHSS